MHGSDGTEISGHSEAANILAEDHSSVFAAPRTATLRADGEAPGEAGGQINMLLNRTDEAKDKHKKVQKLRWSLTYHVPKCGD